LAAAAFALSAGCHRSVRPTQVETLAPDERLTQEQLRADVRQLVGYLESAHPDPYGGRSKVAFHRDVHQIHDAIGPEGMTVAEFLVILQPLIASLHDLHTFIWMQRDTTDNARVWIDLQPVDGALIVTRVYREEDRELLGGVIETIDGVGQQELLERLGRIRGAENLYSELSNLADSTKKLLRLGCLLAWEDRPDTLAVEVRRGDRLLSRDIPIAEITPDTQIDPESAIELPAANAAGMAWGFLDGEDDVAYLRIDTMGKYREAFESWHASGTDRKLGKHLTMVAETATDGPVPERIEERIALVPSGAEMFVELFTAMKASGSSHLIVDLRLNNGGHSFLGDVLAYFLHDEEALVHVDSGYHIRRFSQLFLDNRTSLSVESLREEGFELGDYDFAFERGWQRQQAQGLTEEELVERRESVRQNLTSTPTFERIVGSGEWGGYWQPTVIVLTSARTGSAGYYAAALLHKLGATLVGVPPAQAGNCFIDFLGFRLDHSGLRGGLSYKQWFTFPADPEKGELLRPDVELTLADLERMDFDPNTSLQLALEVIQPE